MGGLADEVARRRALDELGPLEDLWAPKGPGQRPLDALAALASQLTGTPMAAVIVVEDDRQVFVGAAGLPIRATDRELSFCTVTIATPDRPSLVPDMLADDRFATHPLVVGAPGIRSYAGIPLVSAEGVALGTICVMDLRPNELSQAEIDALTSLSHLATELLEARRAATRLATTNSQLLQAQQAQQEARDQFQTVFDRAPLGMALLDDQGVYQHVNPAFARLLGLPIEQVVGESFRRFTAINVEDDMRIISDLVDGRAGWIVSEKIYRRADGTTFPAHVTTFMIRPAESGSCLLLRQVESLATAGRPKPACWKFSPQSTASSRSTGRVESPPGIGAPSECSGTPLTRCSAIPLIASCRPPSAVTTTTGSPGWLAMH